MGGFNGEKGLRAAENGWATIALKVFSIYFCGFFLRTAIKSLFEFVYIRANSVKQNSKRP